MAIYAQAAKAGSNCDHFARGRSPGCLVPLGPKQVTRPFLFLLDHLKVEESSKGIREASLTLLIKPFMSGSLITFQLLIEDIVLCKKHS